MYTIAKTFRFEAAHALPSLPSTHKCHRVHGHSYQMEFILASDSLNEHGFVEDYSNLWRIKEWIDSTLDHKNLNEVVGFPTSAENLAHWAFTFAIHFYPCLVAVRVKETESTYAEYRRPV